jgi:tripartite-type tricarboxylate transporter receptor subunit TctC
VALLASPTSASDYPERTVKIVAPFEAGGTVDAVARFLASRLNARWRVPVIVESRPGAGNIVGASAVAQAQPNGYTLLFANTSISVNPSLYKSLPYDTAKDLAPVVFLSASPNVLLVQKALGVAGLPQLIVLAKSRQQPMTFASVGKGSFHHVSMELFRIAAGVELLHIPYKGAAPAMLAFLRGDVDLYCGDLPGDRTDPQWRRPAARDYQRRTRSGPAKCSDNGRSWPSRLCGNRLCRHHDDRWNAA